MTTKDKHVYRYYENRIEVAALVVRVGNPTPAKVTRSLRWVSPAKTRRMSLPYVQMMGTDTISTNIPMKMSMTVIQPANCTATAIFLGTLAAHKPVWPTVVASKCSPHSQPALLHGILVFNDDDSEDDHDASASGDWEASRDWQRQASAGRTYRRTQMVARQPLVPTLDGAYHAEKPGCKDVSACQLIAGTTAAAFVQAQVIR